MLVTIVMHIPVKQPTRLMSDWSKYGCAPTAKLLLKAPMTKMGTSKYLLNDLK
jgi:hypothetical protein